ncbi:sigma-70 family RNA polymerase sigma factor [Salipaludibacillus sp. HK11]|uniref:sigma-70 family RNA polymerase sigma factor n=1 Tax=Salipaludibacillus sp. HK11 TaxID=3394320 RepID=UPI0039FB9436
MKKEDENQNFTEDEKDLLEDLLDEYGTELKHIAFFYLKDRELAEDIIQEVFISCFKNLHTFRYESSYKTWLIKITVNKCKDSLKKWSFKNIFYREKIKDPIENCTPEKKVIEKTVNENLATEVLQLPLKFREVIILFYYEELSLIEISLVLKINVNTIKSRLSRAKENLRKSIERSDFDG